MNWLELISTNHGLLTAISTAVIAFSTLVVVALTRLLVNENRIWREASTQPRVVAYLHTHGGVDASEILFSVINLGNGPAENVKVKLKNNGEEDIAKRKEDFARCQVNFPYDFDMTYSVLPAGEKRTYNFSNSTGVYGHTSHELWKQLQEIDIAGSKLEREIEEKYILYEDLKRSLLESKEAFMRSQEVGNDPINSRGNEEAFMRSQEARAIVIDLQSIETTIKELGRKGREAEKKRQLKVAEIEKKWQEKKAAKDLRDKLPALEVVVDYVRPDAKQESPAPFTLDVADLPPWASINQTPEQLIARATDATRHAAMFTAASTLVKLSSESRERLMATARRNKWPTAIAALALAKDIEGTES